MLISKPVVSYSVEDFVNQIVDHIKLGWELDPKNPAGFYGHLFEIHLLRDDGIVDPVKQSRAEILARARAAKAAKAAGETPADEGSEEDEGSE